MSSWAGGYVLDIQYTAGFYRELAPAYLQLMVQSRNIRSPRLVDGATYCELGCGQGFGTNLLAATNPNVKFWGFDFNPAQIVNARRLAAEAGLSNITFEDKSFEELARAPAGMYPQFDAIVLHGIYSWITIENRNFIIEILSRYLKPGGVVYVSYNCQPGWAHMAPLQRLIRDHASHAPDRSDVQVMKALSFAKELEKGGARYFAANPQVSPRLEKLVGMNRNYLAHEYLNGAWNLLYHSDVAQEMDRARLRYVGSATPVDNIDAVSVPTALQPVISGISDPIWAETVRDYIVNRQFRKDIFMRGASEINSTASITALANVKFSASVVRSAFEFKFAGPLGELNGQPELYGPVADAICQRPMTLLELSRLPCFEGKGFQAAIQVALILLHANYIHPVVAEPHGKGTESARRLNKVIFERLKLGEVFNFVAAPSIGTAIAVGFTNMVVLAALSLDEKSSIDVMAQRCVSIMKQTNQRLVKDGVALEGDDATIAEFRNIVDKALNESRGLWKNLGVI